MPINDANARVYTAWRTYVAPVGTTAPTGVTQDLLAITSTPWKDLGRGDVKGLDESMTVDQKPLSGYGSNGPLRVINKSTAITYKVSCLETNATTVDIYYGRALGSTVPDSSGSFTFSHGNVTDTNYSFVFDGTDGTSKQRIYVPKAAISNRDSIIWQEDAWSGYSFTVEALISSTGLAVTRWYAMPSLGS